MSIVDYLFYRIYDFYKRHKDSVPVFMGCSIIAMTMFFSLLSLFIIAEVILKKQFEINKLIAAPLIVILILIIISRFKNEQLVLFLKEKYEKEEGGQKRLKGFLIVLYIFVVFAIPFAYGVLKHNYHMDI